MTRGKLKIFKPKYSGSIAFILFSFLWLTGKYQWLALPLIASFFLLMVAILESKQERVLKGTLLIIFGIFFGIFIPDALILNKAILAHLPKDFIGNADIFKNLVVFSCAGAGGSIIGGHAERFLADVEISTTTNNTSIDHITELKSIKNEVLMLKKYFLYFSSVITFLLLVIVVVVT